MSGRPPGRSSFAVRSLLRPALRAAALGLAFGLAALAVAAAPREAGAATVHTRIDLETPGYGGFGRRLSDHFLLDVDGTFHLFYTELVTPLNPVCRIGHATSTDLVRWTERPTVISAGTPTWMSEGAWAPHVIARPEGGWMMLFTGRNGAGAQSIGGLASADLDTWTPVSPAPLWIPPTTWARWDSTVTSSCRDPFVWLEGGTYSMIFTATTSTGRSAIGRAVSKDLVTWDDAGPFAVDLDSPGNHELESPHLVFANGRVELLYTRLFLRFLSAPSSAGPWDVKAGATVDPGGLASEMLLAGATPLLSRVRFDACGESTTVIVIDTVTALPGGYAVPAAPGIPAGWRQDGDAFSWGATFGDGPARRGDVPAAPVGLRWLGSGETYRLPSDPLEVCGSPSRDAQVGTLRTPRFTLLGDSLWFRVMGAASIDSAHVRLLDACTGLELGRRTGTGGSALERGAWSNAGRRGWPVELEFVDRLTRPGGVIGADDVVDSTIGAPSPTTTVAINQTAPPGGVNLTPGTVYTVRWASFHASGLDSHVVYVSYDDFATNPIRLQKRNGTQFTWNWTVPPGPHFAARIRVVAYAKNGVHDCDTSEPFTIGVTTGVPGDPGAGGPGRLHLRAAGNPGPAPVLEWETPAGTRAWLRLYDVRGRLVATLVDGVAGEGTGPRRSGWDGRDTRGADSPAGVYFARLVTDGGDERRVTLVRLSR
jgi:hypothetical protein